MNTLNDETFDKTILLMFHKFIIGGTILINESTPQMEIHWVDFSSTTLQIL